MPLQDFATQLQPQHLLDAYLIDLYQKGGKRRLQGEGMFPGRHLRLPQHVLLHVQGGTANKCQIVMLS